MRELKPHLLTSCWVRRLHAPPSASPSLFKNGQPSDDHLISLCQRSLYREALEAFDALRKTPDSRLSTKACVGLICACSGLKSLKYGRRVHDCIRASGVQTDVILDNHIVNMYGKCGSMADARKVFDGMRHRNVVSWTSLIAGYSQNGQNSDALQLYFEMLQSGFWPDHFTFGSVLKACSGLGGVGLGMQLHAHVVKSEFGSHLIAQNALIAMYTKVDRIGDACSVFRRIKEKDLISWCSIIAGFSQLDHELQALCYFKEMLCQGVYQPNEFTFGSVSSACGNLQQPEIGRQIHGICIKFGFAGNKFAGCALCDMYAKFGLLGSAKIVFRQIETPDLISWNAAIAGFATNGHSNETISYFNQLRRLNFHPDDITVRSLFCACMSPSSLQQGKQMHSYIIKMAFVLDISVCNALVTMYAKCSNLMEAFKAFEEMRHHDDLISWNAILVACMQHKESTEVFKLFKLLLISEVKPDYITLTTMIGAYTEMASLEMGNQVHCYAMKTGLVLDVSVSNSLIDMYMKCGSVKIARSLFDSIVNPDIISWSSLIVGYAQFGHAEEALKLYEKMRSLGVKPNEVTIVGVLTACCHVGLVEEGWELYKTMELEHGIIPTKEHSACVVDLLARAGHLYEAKGFIKQMEDTPDIVVWKALLAASKTHKNLEIGRWAAENLLKLDPLNATAHVLLCSMYASTGHWDDVGRLRSLMRELGVSKVPGQSWIEIKSRVHAFLADDNLHPERDKIYQVMGELWLQLLDHDYVPFQNRVLSRLS
ncbi:pentatricopeptide repeat-containing protein At3g53360, mitochondrial isoform X1 [Syzygium oleosum]|uniref:pentatricopeptide repeat-containing protein At3g53360, mitochondrial isoform X1 n=1 Tax=Syzygium oleosum TaxID=219896 RepID=UPI0024BB0DB9|nr:pentatricopeptide repeat-containing protein At3g53360, mitochondrial isoform X1 [Syzygium oleosum]XP_056161027.1 pentatricopeptide repeat-containing protein At3g53360, mitochondrial isoform X1 [Syzygium oleosum]